MALVSAALFDKRREERRLWPFVKIFDAAIFHDLSSCFILSCPPFLITFIPNQNCLSVQALRRVFSSLIFVFHFILNSVSAREMPAKQKMAGIYFSKELFICPRYPHGTPVITVSILLRLSTADHLTSIRNHFYTGSWLRNRSLNLLLNLVLEIRKVHDVLLEFHVCHLSQISRRFWSKKRWRDKRSASIYRLTHLLTEILWQ